MSITEGHLKLSRRFFEHPLWNERREFSKAEAWLDILAETRFSEKSTVSWIGGEDIECKRGQVIYSQQTWAKRWGWSLSKAKRFIRKLIKQEMLCSEAFKKTTRLTVCNFERYNTLRPDSDPIATRQRPDSDPIATPTEEGKKGRKKEEDTAKCKNLPEQFCKTDMETRLAEWCMRRFRRRTTTEWGDKEIANLRKIANRGDIKDEADTIRKAKNAGWEFFRQSLPTLLNNWTEELDKSREWLDEGQA